LEGVVIQVSEETVTVLLNKMEAISQQLAHLTAELARHQEIIANLTDSVMAIKLERAKERGYVLGALAIGSLAGGLIEKFLRL
jgi:predicted nucleic acid-binding protein